LELRLHRSNRSPYLEWAVPLETSNGRISVSPENIKLGVPADISRGFVSGYDKHK